MSGESILAKQYASDPDAYIIDDVNRAHRNYALARNVLVLPFRVIGGAAQTASDAWELPGRNRFVIQVVTEPTAPSAGAVQLQGSLTAVISDSAWTNIGSAITCTSNTISASITDERPFRFYRLKVSTTITGGKAIVLVAFQSR